MLRVKQYCLHSFTPTSYTTLMMRHHRTKSIWVHSKVLLIQGRRVWRCFHKPPVSWLHRAISWTQTTFREHLNKCFLFREKSTVKHSFTLKHLMSSVYVFSDVWCSVYIMSLLSRLSGCVSVPAVLGSAVTALWLRPLSPSVPPSASGLRRPAGLEGEAK